MQRELAIDEYYIGCTASRDRFSGIYKTADAVPTFGINPFDTKEWVETNRPWMMELRQTIDQNRRGMWGELYQFNKILS